MVSSSNWGSDQRTLLQLYRSLVRSKLDYASVVYGSARRSYLKALVPVQHQGLRIALGAFRTSPQESLYALAGEPPLELRRLRLAMNYFLKVKSVPESPAYDDVFNNSFLRKYDKQPSAIKPFGLRMVEHFENAGIDLTYVCDSPLLTMSPPWKLAPPVTDFSLSSLRKHSTSSAVFKSAFLETVSCKYSNLKHIYTDGSKAEELVAAAAVAGPDFKLILSKRLRNHCSIFTAELEAILLALKIVYQRGEENVLIVSDSMSALQAVSSMKISHPILADIHDEHTRLVNEGSHIVFMWAPSHMGIRGNTAADAAAKDALGLSSPDGYIPYSDLKYLVGKYVNNLWQEQWSQQSDNKLFKILPKLSDSLPLAASGRKAETVLNRLLIGHTYFTHSFLLRNEDPPWCHTCDTVNSVRHVLGECVDLIDKRVRYLGTCDLKKIFTEVSVDALFTFLVEINLFAKI